MKVRSPWIWVVWLLVIVISFALLEGFAVSDPDGLSFSQFFVNINHAWPLFGAVVCIGLGVLLCHLHGWWWVPKQMRETCRQCGREVLKDRHGG